MAKLSVVIPCYYNELNIPVTIATLRAVESQYPQGTTIEYVLVDDGSKDQTWQSILYQQTSYPNQITAIKLATNVGSHNAILAGLNYATGDCTVIISADLQDPPELIPELFTHWVNGYKLVIANRTDRKEGFFKNLFANIFHALIKRYAIKNVPSGGFDCVLFDRLLREKLVAMNEKNTHIFYLLTWMGFPYVSIPYTRRKRDLGQSRWTLSKKIKLFIDTFVSFSYLPIRLISAVGIILGLVALVYATYIVIQKLTGAIEVEGWSALMVVLLLVSAFQMIALGVIGEYVWRSLDAARTRPNFIIDVVKLANTDQ